MDLPYSDACGRTCSKYDAEIKALRTAVEKVHQSFELNEHSPTHIVIFTDSKSALQAIENLELNTMMISHFLLKQSITLCPHDILVTLQWIPGHTQIKGNEYADKLAKEGARKDQSDKPCDNSTVKIIIKNNFKETWLTNWATGQTGGFMYQEMTKPNPHDPINTFCRKYQSIIFQLRTGHTKFNAHLNRINPQVAPVCRGCDLLMKLCIMFCLIVRG